MSGVPYYKHADNNNILIVLILLANSFNF